MCRTDRWACAVALAPLALAVALGTAAAQTSFEDSSFAAGNAAEEPATTGGAWPAAPEGGFGGSFEGGATDATEAEAPTQDTGFGGSFDSEAPAENAAADAEEPAAEDPPETVAEDSEAPPEPPETDTSETAAVEEPEDADPIRAFELRDYGVEPTNWLRQGAFHAATPVTVPGALTITTEGLAEAVTGNGVAFVLIDVLGGDYMLPNALSAPGLATPGNYNDRTQQQASVWLAQVTGGDPSVPVVVYCSDPMCWMSYNAALRAVAAGYTNVYWYRGGLQAWQMAGHPVFPSGF